MHGQLQPPTQRPIENSGGLFERPGRFFSLRPSSQYEALATGIQGRAYPPKLVLEGIRASPVSHRFDARRGGRGSQRRGVSRAGAQTGMPRSELRYACGTEVKGRVRLMTAVLTVIPTVTALPHSFTLIRQTQSRPTRRCQPELVHLDPIARRVIHESNLPPPLNYPETDGIQTTVP